MSPPLPDEHDEHEADRLRMVEHQVAGRDVRDPRVLEALRAVPRHEFVPEGMRSHAHEDRPLPIGDGQTISQPYMVGIMTELLRLGPASRVLEIGTGSGYQTAVLARCAGQVFTIERIPALAVRARTTLTSLGFANVRYRVCDGTRGWPEEAPYDGILVTAAAPDLPPSLFAQLAEGGTMVLPMGGRDVQDLVTLRREGGREVRRVHFRCAFVPLIGVEGYEE